MPTTVEAKPRKPAANLQPLAIHIVGTGGPGTTWANYTNIELSVQIGKSWEGVQPGDIAEFRYTVNIEVDPDLTPIRWKGTAVHGPAHERFLYLVWTAQSPGGLRAGFRRAKLKLSKLSPETVAAAVAAGHLTVTLPLTTRDKSPVCATPVEIAWRAGS